VVTGQRSREGGCSLLVPISRVVYNVAVQAKMIYSSSKEALRRSLAGIHAEIQGTDFSEVAYETVLEKVSKGAGNR